MAKGSNENECLTLLRDTDRDRYLACLLMPEQAARGIAPLYAFNAEIARIRDLVREALPGEIRMQWWRDVLSGTSASDAHAHPVVRDLLETVREHNLPVSSLQNLIDARTFDLYDDPMPDVATLEGYAGETASALIQLSSLVLDPENAPHSAEAAGHAGMAQAIAGLLLLMPMHRQRGQVYLPQTLLAATGLDRDMFLLGKDRSRIGAAVEAFAGLGRDHLDKARSLSGTISKANSLAFLPVSLASPILDRAIRLRADIFEQPLQPQQWRRQWTLWRASRSGRF